MTLKVLAAACLTHVLSQVGATWQAQGGAEVRLSFDATSRLARQVEAGAPADLFFSADVRWLRHLSERGLVRPDSRVDLLGNRLVLVVPATASEVPVAPADLPRLGGRLALASEQAPAGRYADEALRATGVWDAVAARVVRGANVRTALAWVARGEAAAGVVNATDARVEPRVRVAFSFPPSSHTPIVMPAALLLAAGEPAEARGFLDFCRGAAARAIFERAGFSVLPPARP